MIYKCCSYRHSNIITIFICTVLCLIRVMEGDVFLPVREFILFVNPFASWYIHVQGYINDMKCVVLWLDTSTKLNTKLHRRDYGFYFNSVQPGCKFMNDTLLITEYIFCAHLATLNSCYKRMDYRDTVSYGS